MARIGVILLGHELDVHGNESIQINSKMKDFKDISKVFTDVSTSFSLPASKRNNKVFQHYWNYTIQNVFVLNRNQIDYRLKQRCSLEVDGVPYKEGLLKLNSITMLNNKPQDYNCTWIGHTATFADRFGDDTLSDLGWIELNHDIGASTEVAAGLSTAVPQLFDNKLIYPLITDNKIEWTDIRLAAGTPSVEFKPAVRIDQIFEKIQSRYGLTFNMPMLSEDRIQKMYMWLPHTLADEDIDPLTNYRGTILDMMDNTPKQPFGRLIVPLEGDYIRTAFMSPLGGSPDSFTFRTLIFPDAADMTKEYTISIYYADPITKSFTEFTPPQSFTGTGNINHTFTFDNADVPGGGQAGAANGKLIRFYLKSTLPGDSITYDAHINASTVKAGVPTVITTITTTGGKIYDPSQDISRCFPDIKVIDFMSSFIKIFNLVIEPTSDKDFDIMTYDEWKLLGKLVDVTKETDISKYIVNPINLPKEFIFEYENPDAVNNKKFKELTGEAYGDEHLKLIGEASNYSVKLEDFENMLWDRFVDSSDVATNYYIGHALTDKGSTTDLKAEVTNAYLMYWGADTTATIKITGTPDNTITEYKMCDSYFPVVNPTDTLNFGGELNAYTSIAAPADVSLIAKYYNKTLAKIVDPNARKYKFDFVFSFSFMNNIELNDTLKIEDNYFDIEEIGYNMLTSEASITLVNTYRSITHVDPPSDTEPPSIGTLSVVPNVIVNPPTIGALQAGIVTQSSLAMTWYNVGGDSLDRIELFRNGSLYQTFTPSTSTYTDTGLPPSTTYTYKVIVYNTAGADSGFSNEISMTTDSVSLSLFDISPIGHSTYPDACSDSNYNSRWHDGAGAFPTIGDIVCNTNDINDKFNGSNQWYRMPSGFSILILHNGIVADQELC